MVLNSTQEHMLEATVAFLFDELTLNDNTPKVLIEVESILESARLDISNEQKAIIGDDLVSVFEQLKQFIEHPYVQNRSTGSPYIAIPEGEVGFVYFYDETIALFVSGRVSLASAPATTPPLKDVTRMLTEVQSCMISMR